MIGNLTINETDKLLKKEVVGRLACGEGDNIMANWQSAIVFGTFEELSDPDLRGHALKKLHERILPMPSSETTHLSPDWPFPPEEFNKIAGVTFRIFVEKRTGRFEKSASAPITFYSI